MGTFRPGRPVRQLAVDRTLHNTGSIHLPLPLQAQLEDKRILSAAKEAARPEIHKLPTPTSLQKLRSTDLPSLRTQSNMRVLIPFPHTALSLSWQVLQSAGTWFGTGLHEVT